MHLPRCRRCKDGRLSKSCKEENEIETKVEDIEDVEVEEVDVDVEFKEAKVQVEEVERGKVVGARPKRPQIEDKNANIR